MSFDSPLTDLHATWKAARTTTKPVDFSEQFQ